MGGRRGETGKQMKSCTPLWSERHFRKHPFISQASFKENHQQTEKAASCHPLPWLECVPQGYMSKDLFNNVNWANERWVGHEWLTHKLRLTPLLQKRVGSHKNGQTIRHYPLDTGGTAGACLLLSFQLQRWGTPDTYLATPVCPAPCCSLCNHHHPL